MSDFSLTLVLHFKTSKNFNGVAKVQILWEGEYTYRCILTNDYTSTNREIVEFYNLRGRQGSIN